MATEMSLWRLGQDGSASRVESSALDEERVIEEAIESAPELLGSDVLIIGRQTVTTSGPLDLLAIDEDAQLVVIENKRDRTPREVVAQTLDYTAWVYALEFSDIELIFADYVQRTGGDGGDLAEAFEERFGQPLTEISGAPPRMIIVASRLDDSTERMIDFLAETYGVPINAVLFQPFAGGLIGRTWLRPDDPVAPKARGRRSASNSARRDEAKVYWDQWLPIGRELISGITLPKNGPRSPLIARSIEAGLAARFVVWVSSTESYGEVQFDDDDPEVNARLFQALERRRGEIESAFGQTLDWRGLGENGLMTKRTKVVTPKVSIGSKLEPDDAGMRSTARYCQQLLDAVRPHLQAGFDEVTAAE